MSPSRRTAPFSVLGALLFLILFGCETRDYAEVVSPSAGSAIPQSGLFNVTIDFTDPPTSGSYIVIEIQNPQMTFVDITSLFIPQGQSDFAGATTVSADLDATALGLMPGQLRIRTKYSQSGVDGTGTRLYTFTWTTDSTCEEGVSDALRQCFLSVSAATKQCYLSTNAPCDPADFVADENLLRTDIATACTGTAVSELGYGDLLTIDTLGDRLIEECIGNASSLAARMFGGPQAAVLAQGLDVPCLDAAYSASVSYIDSAFTVQSDCVVDEAACDPAIVSTDLALTRSSEVAAIEAACTIQTTQTFDLLDLRVGLDADQALDRAQLQSECMTSAAHGNTEPLPLRCAAGSLEGVIIVGTDPPGLEPLAPAVPTQVMLDETVWGTRCGDGSPYYFWIEMAPPGQPYTNVHMYLNGGGACFTDDCLGVPSSLFTSSDDGYQKSGILNFGGTESLLDPFATWTKANFPYCNQDLHAGGGGSQLIGGTLTVERYGALNVRAGMQVVRNLVAERANAESPDGFRPDQVKGVLSGTSAGAFGVGFNVHYVLDDLRWSDTTFVLGAGSNANAGLAAVLGPLALGSWGVDATVPPYCLDANCFAPASALYAAHSARLLGTPAQQMLVAHNQIDNTQRDTQFYSDTPSHVNALRQTYCDSQGLPGVYWFMAADTASIHPLYASDTIDSTLTAESTVLRDWTNVGIFDPSNVQDRIDEGALVTAFPGVQPFPCTIN